MLFLRNRRQRLNGWNVLNSITLLLYVSTFHYSTVSVLSFLSRIFRILLFFARRLDILLHTEFMEVEKEDDFRFDEHERSKDRLTWRTECGCKSARKPLIN